MKEVKADTIDLTQLKPDNVPFTDKEWEGMCQRCGKCCVFANGIPCTYHHVNPETKLSECRIYKQRILTVVGVLDRDTVYVCLPRWLNGKIVDGCPYNPWVVKVVE